MAHLILEAIRALLSNGHLTQQQYSSFYHHSNPIPSAILYSRRLTLDEPSTILCPEALGKPLDDGYKIEKMQPVLQGLQESERSRLGVNPGPLLFDKLEQVIRHEINFVIDFWNRQSWDELFTYGGLSRVYNRLFPQQPVQVEQGFYDAPSAEQTTERFSQVINFLMQLSRPLCSYKLLPCSQNFCAWLPPDVIKENHLRIASALLKIEDVVAKLSYLLSNGIMCDQSTRTEFSNWRNRVSNARRELAAQSMVIVKQPDHCFKRGVKNSVKVELLSNSALFSLPADPPEVTVTVLDDPTAEILYENGETIGQQGHRVSATCKEYIVKEGVAEIKLNVRVPKRAPWIGRDVLNRKYYLLIQVALPASSQFAPFGCQSNGAPPSPSSIRIWACSSPVVFITNVCQVPDGSKTIFWDLHAHPLNQFQPEAEATFSQIRVAFIEFTKFITQTTWELPPSNINYLVQTVFAVANINAPGRVFRRMLRPDRRTAQERLQQIQERWLLYFKPLVLIKSKLRELWNRGFIMGFISRELAEEIVRRRGRGYFLLRFSTSEAGTLAITDYYNQNKPESGVFSLLQVDHLHDVLHSQGYWPQNVLHWSHQAQSIVNTSKNDAIRPRGVEVPHLLSYPRLFAINFFVVQPQQQG